MAEPRGPELGDDPSLEGSPAPLDPPFPLGPAAPSLPGQPPWRFMPFWQQWPVAAAAEPPAAELPAVEPPAVALTTVGTVSDPAGAAEAHKDKPARFLTVAQATAVLLDLKSQGALKWSGPMKIIKLDSMPWGGVANTFKVRRPTPEGQPPAAWTSFDYVRGEECDPRMAVLLYRLATYLFVEQGATGMEVGILRESTRAELSCHNQGRAVDVFRVKWGGETLDVLECWGLLPFRVNGEPVRQWNRATQAFDKGELILGKAALETFIRSGTADRIRQERLNPDIVVDAAILRSVLNEPDPGPPEGWSEHTRAKADALQVKLRRAATVFLGMFDFFVREATISEGASSFSEEPMTVVGNKAISRVNSGNLCIPDGTAWGGHQNHFHVQIGPTGWAQVENSKTAQTHGEVDPDIRDYLYKRITNKILGLLSAAHTEHETARTKAKAAFETKKTRGRLPADAVWEEQPGTKDLDRAVEIAAGYKDQALLRRIETYDRNKGLAELGTPDDFQTLRGRVLKRWYQGVSSASASWRGAEWLKKLVVDASLSVADARAVLVKQIHADLDKWRMEKSGETSIPPG